MAAGALVNIDEKTRLRTKYTVKMGTHLDHYEEKYGTKRGPKIRDAGDAELVAREQGRELQDLFDAIAYEIDERQQYLEQIEKGGEVAGSADIKERTKREIVDRVGEL